MTIKLEQDASGGPEIWNVCAWGDVRECRDIATVIDEVMEALELGCRTILIERQGAPTASPNSARQTDAGKRGNETKRLSK